MSIFVHQSRCIIGKEIFKMNRVKVIYEHVQPYKDQDVKALKKAEKLYERFKEAVMNSNVTNKKKEILLREFDDFMDGYVDMAFKREQAIKE